MTQCFVLASWFPLDGKSPKLSSGEGCLLTAWQPFLLAGHRRLSCGDSGPAPCHGKSPSQREPCSWAYPFCVLSASLLYCSSFPLFSPFLKKSCLWVKKKKKKKHRGLPWSHFLFLLSEDPQWSLETSSPSVLSSPWKPTQPGQVTPIPSFRKWNWAIYLFRDSE